MPIIRRPSLPTRTFPQRVRKKMSDKGLSQSEVARHVGYTPTGVWNWLQGNTLPRAEAFSSLADLFDVSEEWLRNGDPAEDEEDLAEEISIKESIADKIENLRVEIAELAGYNLEKVKIKLEFTAD